MGVGVLYIMTMYLFYFLYRRIIKIKRKQQQERKFPQEKKGLGITHSSLTNNKNRNVFKLYILTHKNDYIKNRKAA